MELEFTLAVTDNMDAKILVTKQLNQNNNQASWIRVIKESFNFFFFQPSTSTKYNCYANNSHTILALQA